MKKAICFGTIVAILLLSAGGQIAFGFYKWVDDQGNLHVTDSPPPAKYAPEPEPEAQPEPETVPQVPPSPPPAKVAPPTPPVKSVPAPVVPKAAPAPPVRPAVPQSAPARAVKQVPPVPPAAPATEPAATAPHTMPTATAQQAVTGPAVTVVPVPGTPIPISPEPPKTVSGIPGIPKELLPAANVIGALLGGFLLVFVGVTTAYYLYFSLCLFKIAHKVNVGASWLAWVPVIQLFWPFVGAAGKSSSWVLLLLLPILANAGTWAYLQLAGAPIVPIWPGVFLFLAALYVIIRIIIWMRISENLGKGKALGLLMLLPFVNLIVLGYLAFSGPE